MLSFAMRLFGDFLQLCATRAWPLRVFLPGPCNSNFYPPPRVTYYDVSSSVSFTTTTSTPSPSPSAPMLSQTSTSNTSFPRVPLELVLSFIEAAGAEADHDAYVQLLRNCSLVCRAWSTASQKLLFSQVTLRSQRSFELFMNAVDRSAQHGRSLGRAVKRLRVVLDHNQPSGLHQHSFALAVTVCPNLSQLEISLYGCAEPGKDIVGAPDVSRLRRPAPSFDEETLSLLKSGPSVESLHFDNWSENRQSIFQLLDIWPSFDFSQLEARHHSIFRIHCLHSLRSSWSTIQLPDYSFHRLHEMASLQLYRLTSPLHFERDPCVNALEYLVNAHGRNLHSISLPAFGSPDLVDIVAKASNLRELRTENAACPPALYNHLPHEVENLAFGLDRDTPLNTIIDIIKTRNSLRTIDVQLWEGGQNHALLSTLKIACTYRGIHLTTTTDLRLFRTMHTSPKSRW
ncbi:hypothetical protein BDZ97DRAFT_1818347 [Flammula alnicola]|nr:hypothetical protein BDZ97DRAFT_1818347 [Flammula alnicola]